MGSVFEVLNGRLSPSRAAQMSCDLFCLNSVASHHALLDSHHGLAAMPLPGPRRCVKSVNGPLSLLALLEADVISSL